MTDSDYEPDDDDDDAGNSDNQGRQLAGAEPVPENQQGDRDTNPLLDDGILPEN